MLSLSPELFGDNHTRAKMRDEGRDEGGGIRDE
jgi:hypothetical protein